MSARRAKRTVRIGDVFELPITAGFAHVQAIGIHPSYKTWWVVRVLEKLMLNPADDNELESIAAGSASYTVIIGDLGLEEREGRVRYLGHALVPEKDKNWQPILRANSPFHLLPNGRHDPRRWVLDDGVSVRKIDSLTKEQENLTFNEFVPAVELGRRIDRAWDPHWEFKGPEAREFQRPEARDLIADHSEQASFFFLTFTKEKDAQLASDLVRHEEPAWNLRVDKNEVGDETSFVLMLAIPHTLHLDIDTIGHLEDRFDALAKKFNGIYDGNELRLPNREI